jgi:hypothetical protein
MEMHVGGQTKTIPIHRTHHAVLECIHPLTHANVDVHGGFSFGVLLSYGALSVKTIKILLNH